VNLSWRSSVAVVLTTTLRMRPGECTQTDRLALGVWV